MPTFFCLYSYSLSFPNPAEGHAILRWKWMEAGLLEPFSINVYDLKGKLVLQEKVNTVEENIKMLSLKELSPGAYLLEVVHREETPFKEKLIVQ